MPSEPTTLPRMVYQRCQAEIIDAPAVPSARRLKISKSGIYSVRQFYVSTVQYRAVYPSVLRRDGSLRRRLHKPVTWVLELSFAILSIERINGEPSGVLCAERGISDEELDDDNSEPMDEERVGEYEDAGIVAGPSNNNRTGKNQFTQCREYFNFVVLRTLL